MPHISALREKFFFVFANDYETARVFAHAQRSGASADRQLLDREHAEWSIAAGDCIHYFHQADIDH